MIKFIICLLILANLFLLPASVSAFLPIGQKCRLADGSPVLDPRTREPQFCDPDPTQHLQCLPDKVSNEFFCTGVGNPVQQAFGIINPPEAIASLRYGGFGLSQVVNNTVTLIYVIATLIFVFMILISALQWILSGGDKEAVSHARGRLTWAVIGIILLALAFIFIKIFGQLTSFELFAGQKPTPTLNCSTFTTQGQALCQANGCTWDTTVLPFICIP